MLHVFSSFSNKKPHHSTVLNLLFPIKSANNGAATPFKPGRDPTLNGTLILFDPDPRIGTAIPGRGTRHRPRILWLWYRQLRVVTENVTEAVLHPKKQKQFWNQILTQKNIWSPVWTYIEFQYKIQSNMPNLKHQITLDEQHMSFYDSHCGIIHHNKRSSKIETRRQHLLNAPKKSWHETDNMLSVVMHQCWNLSL